MPKRKMPRKDCTRAKKYGEGDASVSDIAYNEATWNGVTTISPSKNAVRDKIEAMGAGAAHAILDGSTHNDSVADTVTRGSLIYANSTPKWDELVLGAEGTYPRSDGTDLAYFDPFAILGEPTGFPNRTDSDLSFVTRTFSIAPSNGSFDYYIKGKKYTVSSSDDIIIDDTSGVHVIYYDGGTLSESVNPSSATVEDVILNKVWVATIYWNTTGAGVAPLLADERHGVVMSGRTHLWLHAVNGSAYREGLTLSGYTEDTGSDAALTFELTDGKYYDEDLEHAIVDGSPATQYAQQLNGGDAEIPIVYKDGSGKWVEDAASTLPYKSLGAGRLAYNRDDGGGNWSQQEVGDGDWVSMTLIATNDWQYPIKAIQGQNEYTDKKTAVEEATAEIISFGGGTLSPEVLTLYRFVLRTKDTFGGTKKTKIEVDGVTDFRTSTVLSGAATATDHGSLGGLADDDHAQYIKRTEGDRILIYLGA